MAAPQQGPKAHGGRISFPGATIGEAPKGEKILQLRARARASRGVGGRREVEERPFPGPHGGLLLEEAHDVLADAAPEVAARVNVRRETDGEAHVVRRRGRDGVLDADVLQVGVGPAAAEVLCRERDDDGAELERLARRRAAAYQACR